MYEITSYGYFGEKSYKEGCGKMKVTAAFDTLEQALDQKAQFEHWAKINNIPPYQITIEEIKA